MKNNNSELFTDEIAAPNHKSSLSFDELVASLPEPYLTNAAGLGPDEIHTAFTLCESGKGGDDWCDSHHSSLLRAYRCGMVSGLIDTDPKSVQYKAFTDHLVSEYHIEDHDSYTEEAAITQVIAIHKDFYPDGETFTLRDSSEKGTTYQPKMDVTFLSRFDKVEAIDTTGSIENPESLDTFEWLAHMFNDKVLTYQIDGRHKEQKGYITTSTQQNHPAANWNFDRGPVHTRPWDFGKELTVEELNEYHFVCCGVASTHTLDIKPDENGKIKHRCKDRVVKNPYMVLECDSKSKVEQERFNGFVEVFRKYAPLVAVIDSGGKSTHYWFATGNTPNSALGVFRNQAIRAGADSGVLKDKSKYVRLPNTGPSSKTRRPQRLLYFDPTYTDPDNVTDWDYETFSGELVNGMSGEVFYCNGDFYIKSKDGKEWVRRNDRQMMTHMAMMGYNPTKEKGQAVSDAASVLHGITNDNELHGVVDRLAGHGIGVVEDNQNKVLVQRGPVWPRLRDEVHQPHVDAYIDSFKRLFGEEQADYFLTWLVSSIRAAYNDGAERSNIGKPAQFLNIVGHSGCGKTLLVKYCLPLLLGGNASSAEPAFQKKDFNDSMFQSILLVLDDTTCLDNTERNRIEQGEIVKNLIVGSTHELRAKFRSSVSVTPFWRMVRLLNWSAIGTLPMIDDPDVADKMMILGIDKSIGELRFDEGTKLVEMWRDCADDFFTYAVRDHVYAEHTLGDGSHDSRYTGESYIHPDVKEELIGSDVSLKLPELLMEAMLVTDPSDVKHFLMINKAGSEYREAVSGNLREWRDMLNHSPLRSDRRHNEIIADLMKPMELSKALRGCADSGSILSSRKEHKTLSNKTNSSNNYGFNLDHSMIGSGLHNDADDFV